MNPTQLTNDNPAYPVQVYSSGVLVDEGVVLESTVLASGGEADLMIVSSGGVANGAELTAGEIAVLADAQITGATVNVYTTLNISSGATGSAIVENGGCVNVAEGATRSGGSAAVSTPPRGLRRAVSGQAAVCPSCRPGYTATAARPLRARAPTRESSSSGP